MTNIIYVYVYIRVYACVYVYSQMSRQKSMSTIYRKCVYFLYIDDIYRYVYIYIKHICLHHRYKEMSLYRWFSRGFICIYVTHNMCECVLNSYIYILIFKKWYLIVMIACYYNYHHNHHLHHYHHYHYYYYHHHNRHTLR